MKKINYVATCGILLCAFFLFACSDKDKEETGEVNYKLEFPEYASKVEEFLAQYITSDVAYYLRQDDQVNVYAKKNLASEDNVVEYLQFTDENVKEAYEPLVD